MKKVVSSTFLIVLSIIHLKSQSFDWVQAMGGTSSDGSFSMTVDHLGNVYTTGFFSGTAYFGPAMPGTTLSSAGDWDAFVHKMDASGNFVWVKSIGGPTWDYGVYITTDTSGNVYTAGVFRETADFDPGPGTVNLTSTGDYDVFIQKMDPNGNFIWVRSFGGPTADDVYSLNVDASGNIYMTGQYENTVDFNPGPGIYNLQSLGISDIFILKLDPLGNFVWAKSIGGMGSDRGQAIKTDNIGNIYTAGYFQSTVDFDPGPGTQNLTSSGSIDAFLLKLDTSGNFNWVKRIGSPDGVFYRSIDTDGSGNIYAAGAFAGTADFDPGVGTKNLTSAGYYDVFIQKLDASGNYLWAKSFKGKKSNHLGGISVDNTGNVYSAGEFSDTVDFDPGIGHYSLVSSDSYDVFIQKMDPQGNFVWAEYLEGSSYDHSFSIATDKAGNIYTSGYFQETLDADPGRLTHNIYSKGAIDAYVLKLNQNVTSVKEIKTRLNIEVFPNPSTNLIQIIFPKEYHLLELTLTNLQGTEILKQQHSNQTNITLNLPENKGVYILYLKTIEGSTSFKVLKL